MDKFFQGWSLLDGGFGTYSRTETTYVTQNFNYNCTIRLITLENDVVETWDYDGNIGGCERYAKSLKSYNKLRSNWLKKWSSLN